MTIAFRMIFPEHAIIATISLLHAVCLHRIDRIILGRLLLPWY
jgi:hypothetical protein